MCDRLLLTAAVVRRHRRVAGQPPHLGQIAISQIPDFLHFQNADCRLGTAAHLLTPQLAVYRRAGGFEQMIIMHDNLFTLYLYFCLCFVDRFQHFKGANPVYL